MVVDHTHGVPEASSILGDEAVVDLILEAVVYHILRIQGQKVETDRTLGAEEVEVDHILRVQGLEVETDRTLQA